MTLLAMAIGGAMLGWIARERLGSDLDGMF